MHGMRKYVAIFLSQGTNEHTGWSYILDVHIINNLYVASEELLGIIGKFGGGQRIRRYAFRTVLKYSNWVR